MRFIPLRARDGSIRAHTRVDDRDYAELVTFRWRYAEGYAVRGERRGGRYRLIRMHRQILGDPAGEVDHRDGDGLNNTRSNLRLVTHAQNGQNRRPNKAGSCKYRGVSWHKGTEKWQARAMVKGDKHHLGFHDTPEQAHEVVKLFREENMPYSEEVRA